MVQLSLFTDNDVLSMGLELSRSDWIDWLPDIFIFLCYADDEER
jgi:hypothetical protein